MASRVNPLKWFTSTKTHKVITVMEDQALTTTYSPTTLISTANFHIVDYKVTFTQGDIEDLSFKFQWSDKANPTADDWTDILKEDDASGTLSLYEISAASGQWNTLSTGQYSVGVSSPSRGRRSRCCIKAASGVGTGSSVTVSATLRIN